MHRWDAQGACQPFKSSLHRCKQHKVQNSYELFLASQAIGLWHYNRTRGHSKQMSDRPQCSHVRDQAPIYLGGRGRGQCGKEAVTHVLAHPGAARSLPHHITEVQSHTIATAFSRCWGWTLPWLAQRGTPALSLVRPHSHEGHLCWVTHTGTEISPIRCFPLSCKPWVVTTCLGTELDHVEKQDSTFSCSPTSSAQKTANCLLFFIFLHIILKQTYND